MINMDDREKKGLKCEHNDDQGRIQEFPEGHQSQKEKGRGSPAY